MAIKVDVYLNFNGTCEEAFGFYAKVFQSPWDCILRYSDFPAGEGTPPLPPEHANKIMHTMVRINEHTCLMGSDVIEGFGHPLTHGNNAYITLGLSSAAQTRSLYEQLSKDAKAIEMPLGEQFWAELYASFQDKFGVSWMLLFEGNKAENF
ncbi:MAG: VOC family protein [Bacteroidales bacterium 45-6]|nr:MAG: VOC family protein [Bacteroidales bacterium 45-6]